jgi:drug/metabolite transporter (DMT)-like permease
MTFIWGTNYSIVKRAFADIDPQAFNAMRMIIASIVFLTIILIANRSARRSAVPPSGVFHTPAPLTSRDWIVLAGLGVVGHALYQYFFVGGLALTTVANSSLILAATPVLIAIVSAVLGIDRVGPLHWVGALLSLVGIYIVVGHGSSAAGATVRGDMMMLAAVCCWAVYTLAAGPLMKRHSPVGVTGISMAIGTLVYVPVVMQRLRATPWTSLSAGAWMAVVYSALFALCIAYTIWYTAVREIGSARTAVYSNLIPIVAMLTAVAFLGERFTVARLAGAACVLIGVALTRVRIDLLKLQ